ncbi:hypothetical protein LTR56_011461 [Elasticomyces elasticus]|nr:hypothetical protein LTR56_011461 [Elasticomyces elasticus]KAK3655945.1 hypothetical protein LTR22_009954 [Elasticomyces elasticus]KAK4921444.1 hypothetical protein LTR49_011098 [Elasticomyces elasticus]KAK5760084.1 hypothetical protein LTS12_009815 [Elasticomyces elasticus]
MAAPEHQLLEQTNTAEQPPPSLLTISVELRLLIYAHLFDMPNRSAFELPELDGYIILPPLTRTCRDVREETMMMYRQHLDDVRAMLAESRQWLDRVLGLEHVLGGSVSSAEWLRHRSEEIIRIDQMMLNLRAWA